ncbi:MAG: hypothetical protein WKF47_07065 [Geodermatophilaceae bacterium]
MMRSKLCLGDHPDVLLGQLRLVLVTLFAGHPEREVRGSVGRAPPPLPAVAALRVVDDEAVLGEHPQVIAGHTAGLTDPCGQAGRRRRSVLPQQP